MDKELKIIHNVNGPYKFNYDSRRQFVVITYTDGSKRSISYPRYVMEQYLGYPLPANKDIHHKDGNPENNNIDNLEIVDRIEHRVRHSTKYNFVDTIENCVVCGKEFLYSAKCKSNYKHNTGKTFNENPTCSKVCQCKFARKEQLRRDSQSECQ